MESSGYADMDVECRYVRLWPIRREFLSLLDPRKPYPAMVPIRVNGGRVSGVQGTSIWCVEKGLSP